MIPWMIAAVKVEDIGLARMLVQEQVAKDKDVPEFYIVWDPKVLSAEQYSRLITSLGNIVRDAGGVGVCRVGPGSQFRITRPQ